MTVQPTNNQDSAESARSLLDRARTLAGKLSWLSSTDELDRSAGKEFGRRIESSINNVIKNQQALLISLRKQDAAIVMGLDQYEEIVHLKSLCLELLEEVKEKEISAASDEFDRLFQQITSPQSRKAADLLFSAPMAEFSNAYKPGDTEEN